ncbi:hypothetical protein FRB94_010305 [Tulasnella sp. JGI-2019a]|nr:hypothetical protein FRB94_010305 [Tulasnella sp. JGI-2019a]
MEFTTSVPQFGSIAAHRRTLANLDPHSVHRIRPLLFLADELRKRYRIEHFDGDITEAVACRREAISLTPPFFPGRPTVFTDISTDLRLRHSNTFNAEDLAESIECDLEALALRPLEHPERAISLHRLGQALYLRYQREGDIQDVEKAIDYHREALVLRPLNSDFHVASLTALASTTLARFEKLGGEADLGEVIMCRRNLLELFPQGHLKRPKSLFDLSQALLIRSTLQDNFGDTNEAIKLSQELLQLLPSGDPQHVSTLGILGNVYFRRYQLGGAAEDLGQSISHFRQALHACSPNDPKRIFQMTTLSNAILTRYQLQGDPNDLADAIAQLEDAYQQLTPVHHLRASTLHSLAGALCVRFSGETTRMEDIDRAICYLREVASILPADHEKQYITQLNLNGAYLHRFLVTNKEEDLELAIRGYEELLEGLTSGHRGRCNTLMNLGYALQLRCVKNPSREDAEAVILRFQEAESLVPPEHPSVTLVSRALASTYYLLYDITQNQDDVEKSMDLFKKAVEHPTGGSYRRLEAAFEWTVAAHHIGRYHPSRLEAYKTALSVMHRHIALTPKIVSRHQIISSHRYKSLASNAAACAVEYGRLEEAVELLERGRVIVLSEMSGYRNSLDALREIDDEAADTLDRLNRELERTVLPSQDTVLATDAVMAVTDEEAARYRTLSEERDELLSIIRHLPGFTDFLQIAPFEKLRMSASAGPVVVVNISSYRSGAIIVTETAPPELVPLPNITPAEIDRIHTILTKALASEGRDRESGVDEVLRALWNGIVVHIVTKLKDMKFALGSRIWWCPTSKLCALPLHAAGIYRDGHGSSRLPDLFTCSYTPSLSALIRAREDESDTEGVPRILAVGVANPEGSDQPLKSVPDELVKVKDHFPNATLLEDATYDTMVDKIPDHFWVHLSCHGHHNPEHPFNSHFQLQDKPLSLHDIVRARLPNADLAVLSACHSAAGDSNTPDESLHLASVVQLAGFRSVVGTLWAMDDEDGPDVADTFYRYMLRQGGSAADSRDAAKGLVMVTRGLRRKPKMSLDRWVNFIHIGA